MVYEEAELQDPHNGSCSGRIYRLHFKINVHFKYLKLNSQCHMKCYRNSARKNLIDMVFGTYNELPLYFQLRVTTWYLNGFHGNHSYNNDVTSSRYL